MMLKNILNQGKILLYFINAHCLQKKTFNNRNKIYNKFHFSKIHNNYNKQITCMYFYVLNIGMPENYHLIYGFSKDFVNYLSHNFVFY